MPALPILQLVAGAFKQIIPAVVGGTPAQGGAVLALNDQGFVDSSVMPTGFGADIAMIQASEAISAGSLVNVYNSGTTQAPVASVRNADAATGKDANGFVLAAVAANAQAAVYGSGRNTGLSGLTPGPLFLSDSAVGGVTSTPPTTSGHIVQRVGTAVSTTVIEFRPFPPVTLA